MSKRKHDIQQRDENSQTSNKRLRLEKHDKLRNGVTTGSRFAPRDTLEKSKESRNAEAEGHLGNLRATNEVASLQVINSTKEDRKRLTNGREDHKLRQKWTTSEATGGHLVDVDPVFSPDERFLLLAYHSCVRIYATASSLLLRTLLTSADGVVTSFTLAASNEAHLYVSLSSGRIECWDWVEGKRLGQWKVKSDIRHIAISSLLEDKELVDIVYTVDYIPEKYNNIEGKKNHLKWLITAHRLGSGAAHSKTELRTLYRSTQSISYIRVLDAGNLIVASAGKKLIIGTISQSTSSSVKNRSYVWRELQCAEQIRSLGVRTGSDTGTSRSPLTVDIALGGSRGAIFLYKDLLRQLVKVEKEKKGALPIVRRMHWHRNAVCSIKWSKDGNYLVSGGAETVMVLWQLETGNRQFLPHLMSMIEAITVSPSGSSYAVRTADNAAMVLSTLDLHPKVSIQGIQIPVPANATPFLPSRFPATLVPSAGSAKILLAVPASAPQKVGSKMSNAAYLQTIDARSGLHLAKQTLTRTNITDRTSNPEGTPIDVPGIVLLQTSRDGKWLATVEEWAPPLEDLTYLALNPADGKQLQAASLEVYLKFWSWNEDAKTWELASRIEGAHSAARDNLPINGKIFDLVASSYDAGFITFGSDGLVRRWSAKIRYRHGQEVRDERGVAMSHWLCQKVTSVPILASAPPRDLEDIAGKIAISADGSLLAVAQQRGPASLISLIDTATDHVYWSRADLSGRILIDIHIIDSYLVIFSEHLVIWNLVDDDLQYNIMLRSAQLPDETIVAFSHLAVDRENGTFAIAVPDMHMGNNWAKAQSRLAIFDPKVPAMLFSTLMPHPLRAMLAASHRKGYYCVDAAAEVRIVAPGACLPITSGHAPQPEARVFAGLQDVFGNAKSAAENRHSSALVIKNNSSATAAKEESVVRQHDLSEIFSMGQDLTLPSVTSMFVQVALLFSKGSA